MIKISIILLLTISGFTKSYSQVKTFSNINAEYVLLCEETFWTYEFLPNANSIFKIRGHLGNVDIKSKYVVIRDTIVLTALPRKFQDDPIFYIKNDALLIESDTCLINLHSRGKYRLRIKEQDLFYEECVIKYPTAMNKEKSRDSVR